MQTSSSCVVVHTSIRVGVYSTNHQPGSRVPATSLSSRIFPLARYIRYRYLYRGYTVGRKKVKNSVVVLWDSYAVEREKWMHTHTVA